MRLVDDQNEILWRGRDGVCHSLPEGEGLLVTSLRQQLVLPEQLGVDEIHMPRSQPLLIEALTVHRHQAVKWHTITSCQELALALLVEFRRIATPKNGRVRPSDNASPT